MMSKFNDLLHLRFKQKQEKKTKMKELVERANKGELSSFSGVFRVSELNDSELIDLATILKSFRQDDFIDVEPDLKVLSQITAEVKAIANQAVILHGERIKKAQELLKGYREGAFTAWLLATYGNRQTPYNFLQYYEFYSLMPETLHSKMDQMPRQAIYTLASRSGAVEKKEVIVKNYAGEPKAELLTLIRKEFPLSENDRRAPSFSENVVNFLKRAKDSIKNPHFHPTQEEREKITALLEQIQGLLK